MASMPGAIAMTMSISRVVSFPTGGAVMSAPSTGIGVGITTGGFVGWGVQSGQFSYLWMSGKRNVSSATMATVCPFPVAVVLGTYAFLKSEPMYMFTPVETHWFGAQVGTGPEPERGCAM